MLKQNNLTIIFEFAEPNIKKIIDKAKLDTLAEVEKMINEIKLNTHNIMVIEFKFEILDKMKLQKEKVKNECNN